MGTVRWAFNVAAWAPGRAEWSAAMRVVQPEERERIGRFHFRGDARASLAGRLMLRRLLSRHTGLPWSQLRLQRTDKGKPFLAAAGGGDGGGLVFNVSHQGRFTVLAAEPAAGTDAALGCDVARVVRRPGAPPPAQFFATMRRQFTPAEWAFICGPGTERQQLARFHRCWALKESFVKAEGVGIGFSLQRVSFTCRPAELPAAGAVTGTALHVDGALETRYRFEESRLDAEHVVAVAVRAAGSAAGPPPSFELLTADQLLEGVGYLSPEEPADWERYLASEERDDGL
ncbi:L-aminoadipate-semialdehyde dehydrogenase-phosphopantetheinyl transferase [Amphibalanus amphitrite]|uniref:L-aminoadipate-semialdehyde dehydrogenase-phosphopantetheinyl transferase n=1 Tax=Amphibalanus amphitrite TaxID=1232801 RepID=A0A6A4WQ79_AMPAM|nr:L-aminoadipate-semialdehyde dehydrogenase-phosphopantetheinyl transferase [Amphibalanus amphitrite]